MKTINQKFEITLGANPVGTHLQGYLKADYKRLKMLLGEPSESDGYKVDAEWDFRINGKVITVYNYKTGKNYLGSSWMPKTKITNWHIGGATDIKEECEFLASKLNGKFEELSY